MGILLVGLVLFFGVHCFTSLRTRRQLLIDRFGEHPYKLVYSLLAIVGLVLIVWGYSRTTYTALWQAPSWGKSVAPFFMLPALYGVIAANTPSRLKLLTRNPMAWGTLLWATFHLLNNGDLASLLLFGSFAVFSVFNMWSSNQRPAPAPAVPQTVTREAFVMLLTVLLYLALVMFHPVLFGVPVY